MDLGVVLSDVTAFAITTLAGFGPIMAAFVGLGLAFAAIRRLVRR